MQDTVLRFQNEELISSETAIQMIKNYYFTQIKLRLVMCLMESEVEEECLDIPAASYARMAISTKRNIFTRIEPSLRIDFRPSGEVRFSASFDVRRGAWEEEVDSMPVFGICGRELGFQLSDLDTSSIMEMVEPWKHPACASSERARVVWNTLQRVSFSCCEFRAKFNTYIIRTSHLN